MQPNLISSYRPRLHDQLDWQVFVEKFSSLVFFEKNQKILANPPLYSNKDSLSLEFQRFEAISREDSLLKATFSSIKPHLDSKLEVSAFVKRLQKVEVLEAREYFHLASVIQKYLNLKNLLERQQSLHFFLLDLEKRKTVERKIVKESLSLFDEEGEILYQKHPTLRPLWKAWKKKEEEASGALQKTLKYWQKQKVLQAKSWDYIYGKLVLPVQSTEYIPALGKIIYRSQTGQTFFVEPKEIQHLNEETQELKYTLEKEVRKILYQLSVSLKEFTAEIETIYSFFIKLDEWLGKVRFHQLYKLQKPTLSETQKLNLKEVYHPLIEDPIKNDFEWGEGLPPGVLISGPNTGGKSVFLKACALCLALPHWGFFVPASFSEVPLTSHIFYISNDQQSLGEGLSSFSSEAKMYLGLVKNLPENSFIFIDEVFNSTSSEEASILAYSLLKRLVKRNHQCCLFLTTHHLKLKNMVFEDKTLLSGHMGFTQKQKKPTYKFHLGSPGQSFALEVFSTIEQEMLNSDKMTEEAKSLHDHFEVKLEKILSDLNTLQSENEKLKNHLEIREKTLSQKEKALEGELFLKQKDYEKALHARYQKNVDKLERFLEHLKEDPGRYGKKQIEEKRREIKRAASDFKSENKPELPTDFIDFHSISIGDHVKCYELGAKGKVVAINERKKQVQINQKGLKLWLSSKALSKENSSKSPNYNKKVHVHIERESSESLELKALGLRHDEFVPKAERACLDVLNGSIPYVDIIHGHGDGILKRALYKIIKNYDDLQGDFLEGNDGTTRIVLKNS